MLVDKVFLLSSPPFTTMAEFSLRTFKRRLPHYRSRFRRFLSSLKRNPPRNLDRLAAGADKEVWKEVDCLSCANCCKVMTPTYTEKDMKRIASYLGITVAQMKEKWLKKERGSGDWINRSTPCQFLDLRTHHCRIYEVRPADCAGFPHLTKRRMTEYLHIHRQNIELCPATFNMVEKMMKMLGENEKVK